MIIRTMLISGSAAVSALVMAQSAFAGAHTWIVNELFSTSDGLVQFIELKECCGGNFEVNLNGAQVKSDSTGNVFTFPSNLVAPTGFRHILLATRSFADLPGAPTPDHIIPANFFNQNGDTVRYSFYDAWTVGAVPVNCTDSLHRAGGAGPNTPTNYANQTATAVNACPVQPCPADITGDSLVNVSDLLAIINTWGPCPAPCPPCASDINADCQVNVTDLLGIINGWGPCP